MNNGRHKSDGKWGLRNESNRIAVDGGRKTCAKPKHNKKQSGRDKVRPVLIRATKVLEFFARALKMLLHKGPEEDRGGGKVT